MRDSDYDDLGEWIDDNDGGIFALQRAMEIDRRTYSDKIRSSSAFSEALKEVYGEVSEVSEYRNRASERFETWRQEFIELYGEEP